LDTQAPDQQQGLIAEREGKIKIYVISNPEIILYRHISSIQRSMTVVDTPTIAQLQLQSLGDKLNHSQVMFLQSTLIVGSN
jgi:hypothetical protein